MQKTIIPFYYNSNWETNHNCKLCESIDEYYKDILNNKLDKSKINFLDNLLVDGYGLLKVYEKNGSHLYEKEKLDLLNTYLNDNEHLDIKIKNILYNTNNEYSGYKSDIPTIRYGRWCSRCGSRKPNIFDSLRYMDYNLIKIKNIHYEIVENIFYLNFEDIDSDLYSKTEIYINEDLIETYNKNNKYQSNKFMYNLEKGKLYYVRIVNYDITETVIGKYQDVVYISSDDIIPPEPIKNIKAKQVRKIVKEKDNLINKEYIELSFDTDNKYIIRIGEKNYVPANENDGLEVSKLVDINEYKLEVGHTYYFKPFPYDEYMIKDNTNGLGYVKYCNFNYDSDYTYLKLLNQCDNTYMINYIEGNENIKITWRDPMDTTTSKWKKTLLVIKEGTNILNENDGKVIEITDKNKYASTPYIFDKLTNGNTYYIGIFPVNENGLVNVCLENQLKVKPGYFTNDLIFNSKNKFNYMGHWTVSDNTFNTTISSLCFFDTDIFLEYGGKLTFKVKADGLRKSGKLDVYMNNKVVYTLSQDTDWIDVDLNIDINQYLKVMFLATEGLAKINVSLKDVKLSFNKYPF